MRASGTFLETMSRVMPYLWKECSLNNLAIELRWESLISRPLTESLSEALIEAISAAACRTIQSSVITESLF